MLGEAVGGVMHDSPRFLIIDDDAVDRLGLKKALSTIGRVDEAADATAAVESVKNAPYDLVLVDYFLPPLRGPEVLRQLREVRPGLSAVFLSGHGGERVAAEAMRSGAENYLSKTVLTNPTQLRKICLTAVESGRLRIEADRAHARLELAVEAASLGTWSFDSEARQFRGDARFRALLALPPGSVWSEEKVLGVFPENERLALYQGLTRGEVALRLPVFQGQWVDLRGRTELHSPRNMFGIALDVTAQKTEEQRSSSLREQLMGIASHDLKNPLSAVTAASSILARSPNLNERERGFVTHIRNSAERMTNLIVQLLDLTRVRLGGGLPVARQQIPLHRLIEGVVNELRLASVGREVIVQADTSDVSVDPDRFAQVASNLIGNALKHSVKESAVLVTLKVNENEAVFSVHNHGTPISADAQKLIFEPFVQVGDKAQRDGLGLGLHISREIVRAHGGTLTVHSTVEEGTTFTVHLPR